VEQIAGRAHEGPSDDVKTERAIREEVWDVLKKEGESEVAPQRLRDLGAYGGAQGIWVDKARTGELTPDGAGIAVSVLHTGSTYPDDLTDDGLIYHYPETDRGEKRDAGEVEALKWASRLSVPVFTVTRSPTSSQRRQVRLSWVELWDDQAKEFLISFSDSPPEVLPLADELPFFLTATEDEIRALRKVRRGQQRFKFEVEQRYGSACALCGLAVRGLVEAAHLCAKADEGSNDPRNGLPLCVLHHRALDRALWAIDPTSLVIRIREGGPTLKELRISNESIKGLPELPHPAALEYIWQNWLSSGP